MEHLIAAAVILLSTIYIAWALRHPYGIVARLGDWLYLAANASLVGLCFVDWSYSELEVTPIQVARDGWPLILLPGALGLANLLLFARRGWDAIWTMFMLSTIGFVIFIPILLWIEHSLFRQGILLSFLAPAPFTAVGIAALSPMLAAPGVCRKIPSEGTRLWRIAYRRRLPLLRGIESLAGDLGWQYHPPRSILEAGSTSGEWKSRAVQITTYPSLLPFRYGVRIAISEEDGARPIEVFRLDEARLGPFEPSLRTHSGAVWFDGSARVLSGSGELAYEYRSVRAIPIDAGALRTIIGCLVAVPAT